MSVLNSGIFSNPLQSSPNCRQSPIHRPTVRIPHAIAISTIPYNRENPYESENSKITTENTTLTTARIPGDSDNPWGQREYLPTATIPGDNDNPWRQRQSLRQREQREYHGGSYPSDSENPFQQRESLATARIPGDSSNLYDSENTTENTTLPTTRTLTTARVPGNSENP